MEKAIVTAALNGMYPGIKTIPKALIDKASNLVSESKFALRLNRKEEPARVLAMCVLAAEYLASTGKLKELPTPQIRPPVAPNVFAKLLKDAQKILKVPVKQALDPVVAPEIRVSARTSPAKKQSQKSPERTPRKRTAARYATDLEDIYGSEGEAQDEDDEAASIFRSLQDTPQKRTMAVAKAMNASQVEQFIDELEVAPEVGEAIRTGHSRYSGLVKDPTGLLMGIAQVLISRADPAASAGALDTRIVHALRRAGGPESYTRDHLDAWIPWARQIVAGQTWVAQVSRVPEKQKRIIGGLGSWTFPMP